jgi:hypothetical protein
VLLSPKLLDELERHCTACGQGPAYGSFADMFPVIGPSLPGHHAQTSRSAGRALEKGAPSHAKALLRYSSARSRRRPPHHPETVRP